MTRIVVVRHGHVAGIDPARFRGRADLPLTELGREQARATAASIHARWQPALVYTSPLQRCVLTGQMIADACGVGRRSSSEFLDLDYGSWQGRACEEVRRSSPREYARWLDAPALQRFPSGESLPMLAARIAEGLRTLLDAHAADTVVIVGHDSGNRVLLLQALGLPLSAYWHIAQEPCGLSELVIERDSMRVQRLNETAHLAGILDEAVTGP